MLVMIFSLVFCAFAQDISWDAHQMVLHDGLQLYTHKVPKTKMLSVMFRYRLPYDIPDGAAHFVEHLMFSYRQDGRTYDQILEQLGGESQGRTDIAMMKLNVRIPVESWEDWVQLEKSRYESPCTNIDEDIFEAQRMVIVQEYMQGLVMKERLYAQELRTAVFGERGRGQSVIGSIDHISDWGINKICTYMNQITAHTPIDVFVVGDVGEIDVASDIKSIFSTHRKIENGFVRKEDRQIVHIEYKSKGDMLFVLWPLPLQSHVDTLSLRYWMMMMTHTRFGVWQRDGIHAQGWIEYGFQGGYLLFMLKGKKVHELERSLRKRMYGLGGWTTVWKYWSLVSKVYQRSVVHSWKTLDGRLSWLEYCVDSAVRSRCFTPKYVVSPQRLNKVKKEWLRWENASTLRVLSP